MSDLGVIGQPMIAKEQWFKKLAEEQPSLTVIQEKEELSTIAGVIIPLTQKAQLPLVVERLRMCQVNPQLFIWIFSTVSLDYEQELLLEFGANDVVTEETQIHRLSLIITNTFRRVKQPLMSNKEGTKGFSLNEQNQSVFVNGREELLTRNEYKLLIALYENKETCMSYEQLIATIWPNNKKADLYRLANVVFHLRDKIKESYGFEIKNIRDKGYMFTEKKGR